MSELELEIEKLIKDQILITESEAQDLATLICNLPEINGGRVGAEVIKGDSPSAVANKWRYREFIVSEKTNTDPTVYQFILDRNGVALLFTNEFTNIEGSSILIKREIIEDMVNKLNIAEQATASL